MYGDPRGPPAAGRVGQTMAHRHRDRGLWWPCTDDDQAAGWVEPEQVRDGCDQPCWVCQAQALAAGYGVAGSSPVYRGILTRSAVTGCSASPVMPHSPVTG